MGKVYDVSSEEIMAHVMGRIVMEIGGRLTLDPGHQRFSTFLPSVHLVMNLRIYEFISSLYLKVNATRSLRFNPATVGIIVLIPTPSSLHT